MVCFLVGCQSNTNPSPSTVTPSNPTPDDKGYPAPTLQTQSNGSGYPAPQGKRYSQSAFQSYSAAEEAAKKWNAKATLHQIPATYQMEMNLGHSATGEGWFFMFKVQGSPLEYYVYVSNGKVSGTSEAQPIILGGKSPYEFQELPAFSKMWDSDRVVDLFLQRDGKKYTTDNPQAVLNPQLNYLKGDAYPAWQIFDASKPKDNTVLFKVNAYNGEVIPVK